MVEEVFPQRLLSPQCSRKGCRSAGAWSLRWNNPKLHDPAYRKTWLACDDHREYLTEFLAARGFLREVTTFRAPQHDSTP